MDLDSALLERVRREGRAFGVTPGIRLRLTGADAFRYLNGQITRDLRSLGECEALSACILTPKGRLCAFLSIRRAGDDLIVESDAEVGEALGERLERYLVADDVVITRETWPERIHLFGDAAKRIGEGRQSTDAVACSRLGVPGYDVPADSRALEGLLDPAVVEILRIERGIPKWGAELTEETLPPEAGLDRTAIDYDRGCYPGQEVISRLKSIGRVNRLLHGFHSSDSLQTGMKILSSEEKGMGSLTSAARLPGESGWIALGYLPRGAAEPLFGVDPLTGERRVLSITATFGT